MTMRITITVYDERGKRIYHIRKGELISSMKKLSFFVQKKLGENIMYITRKKKVTNVKKNTKAK